MATTKREIYARMATQLRHHERCAIAEKTCPGAMGLYAFLLIQSRGEETRGDVLEDVAYASWGAPLAYRKKQAEALVKAGLVERNGDRLHVVKYLDHNDGPEEIAKHKAASKKRYDEWHEREKAKHPTPEPTADKRVGDALSAISISSSILISGSESRSPEPDPARATPKDRPSRPHNDAPPAAVPTSLIDLPSPDRPAAWWASACETVSAEVLGGKPVDMQAARWREYLESVQRRGMAPRREHAVSYLSKVIRDELRKAPRHKVDTRQPLTGPEPKWLADAKAGRTGTGDF